MSLSWGTFRTSVDLATSPFSHKGWCPLGMLGVGDRVPDDLAGPQLIGSHELPHGMLDVGDRVP